MPRAQVYSDDEIIAALKKTDGLVYLAAKVVGCDPDTIYRRAKSRPKVADCLKNQRGEFVDVAEKALRKAVIKGQGWAVALVLKTLGKDRGYVERDPDKPPDPNGSGSGVPVELVTRLFAMLGTQPGGPGTAPVASPVAPEAGGAVGGVAE